MTWFPTTKKNSKGRRWLRFITFHRYRPTVKQRMIAVCENSESITDSSRALASPDRAVEGHAFASRVPQIVPHMWLHCAPPGDTSAFNSKLALT